jgi:hypothetical protein
VKPMDIVKLLAAVRATWTNFEPSEGTPKVWALVLRDVDYAEAEAALMDLMASDREFAPPPGVVRQAVESRRSAARYRQMLAELERDRAEQTALERQRNAEAKAERAELIRQHEAQVEAWQGQRRAIAATSTTHPQEEAP